VPAQFQLGWSIAIGDLNGDGRGEIIIGAQSLATYVAVFDGVSGVQLNAFFAFGAAPVGVNVATGDLGGDGIAEIVVAPTGLAPIISVFAGNGALLNSFFAFNPAGFPPLGATVAVGDFNGDGLDEIVAGINLGSGNFALRYDNGFNLAQIIGLPPASTPGVGLPLSTADFNGDGLDDLAVGVNGAVGVFFGPSLGLGSIFFPPSGGPGSVTLG
jgi:hypothetical protein